MYDNILGVLAVAEVRHCTLSICTSAKQGDYALCEGSGRGWFYPTFSCNLRGRNLLELGYRTFSQPHGVVVPVVRPHHINRVKYISLILRHAAGLEDYFNGSFQ